jgi:hypothetical protein
MQRPGLSRKVKSLSHCDKTGDRPALHSIDNAINHFGHN